MTNPTTPFSWQMPTATDLVTDLPADFAVFGQAVATSMADLLGGTTGQILAKATNTDMDFTWVTNDVGDITAVTAGTGISGGGTSGAVTITNSMATEITAKGDLIAGTGSATFDNLPVGANGETLVADSSTSTGLKWATPTSGMTVLSSGSLASGGTSLTSISQSYKDLVLVLRNSFPSVSLNGIRVRLNGDTGGNYNDTRIRTTSTTTNNSVGGTGFFLDDFSTAPITTNQGAEAVFSFLDYTNTTTRKLVNFPFFYQTSGSVNVNVAAFGAYISNSALTQIDIAATSGNLSGTYILYGVN
jgi:hypothetical protein